MRINKDRGIGKVLFVVEGEWIEFYILRKIFTQIFDYQVEELARNSKNTGSKSIRGIIVRQILTHQFLL